MYSDNVHNDLCRDRYEGQLNEFLLENKNLKEQLTTLKVVSSDVEICFIENFILGCGGPVGRCKGGGARGPRFEAF